VPHYSALLIDRFLGTGHTILRCQLSRYQPAFPRLHPYMRESQKIEAGRQHLAVFIRHGLRLVAEIDHGGLIRVKLQPVFAKPLAEHLQHPLRVVLVFKQHDKVIRETDKCARSPQPWLHLIAKPFVEHIVQEDVG